MVRKRDEMFFRMSQIVLEYVFADLYHERG